MDTNYGILSFKSYSPAWLFEIISMSYAPERMSRIQYWYSLSSLVLEVVYNMLCTTFILVLAFLFDALLIIFKFHQMRLKECSEKPFQNVNFIYYTIQVYYRYLWISSLNNDICLGIVHVLIPIHLPFLLLCVVLYFEKTKKKCTL